MLLIALAIRFPSVVLRTMKSLCYVPVARFLSSDLTHDHFYWLWRRWGEMPRVYPLVGWRSFFAFTCRCTAIELLTVLPLAGVLVAREPTSVPMVLTGVLLCAPPDRLASCWRRGGTVATSWSLAGFNRPSLTTTDRYRPSCRSRYLLACVFLLALRDNRA